MQALHVNSFEKTLEAASKPLLLGMTFCGGERCAIHVRGQINIDALGVGAIAADQGATRPTVVNAALRCTAR